MSSYIECCYFVKKGHTKQECRMRIRTERFQKSSNPRRVNRGGYRGGERVNNGNNWRGGNNSRSQSTHQNSYNSRQQVNDQNQPMG